MSIQLSQNGWCFVDRVMVQSQQQGVGDAAGNDISTTYVMGCVAFPGSPQTMWFVVIPQSMWY